MGDFVIQRYGVDVDLSIEGKTQCPKCHHKGRDNSRDNLHVYGLDSTGRHKGAYCHSCEYTIPSEEYLEELQEDSEEEDYEDMGSDFNGKVLKELKERTTTDSHNYRGISSEVSSYFNVRYELEDGEVSKVLYPTTKDFKLAGYKVRQHPKNFTTPYGEVGKDVDLFGQFRFKNAGGKYVLITCGEHDQLAAYQMLLNYQKSRGNSGYDPIPVVSPTIGESGAHKQIQQHYEWFNKFDKIVYCVDNDEAGYAALAKVARVLPKHKLFVMNLSTVKDPNEALQKGKEKEFISKFFGATEYVPSGIVGSGTLLDRIKLAAVTPKIPLPPFMHKLQSLMAGGIPLKTILCLGSASGTGKSTYVDEMIYYWIFNSPHKVGILSLESDSAQYGTKILSRHIQRKIDLIEDDNEKINLLNTEEIEEKANHLFKDADGSHRFHLIEERDGSLESLQELIMQLVIECDVKVCIIDPLQDLLDGLSNEEQAKFMKWLKGLVKSHDVTFILVNHVRKSTTGSKANSKGADISEEDFAGSSTIFKSSACNLLFTRNKEHEDEFERNITNMKMTKCRWTGRTSPAAGRYYYDNDTHTLFDLQDYLDKHPEIEYSDGLSIEPDQDALAEFSSDKF